MLLSYTRLQQKYLSLLPNFSLFSVFFTLTIGSCVTAKEHVHNIH